MGKEIEIKGPFSYSGNKYKIWKKYLRDYFSKFNRIHEPFLGSGTCLYNSSNGGIGIDIDSNVIKLHNSLKINNLIKYYVNINVRGIGRRKNTIGDGYCLKVYRTLSWIKEELDKIAEEEKNKIEQKTKYCTELESYYKKLYNRVSISTSKSGESNGGEIVSINISCSDADSYVNYSSERCGSARNGPFSVGPFDIIL